MKILAASGYGYNGEYYDAATGMLNFRARQYEPASMRFSQRDILKGDASVPLTLGRYLYCWNDPVNYGDFDGRPMMIDCTKQDPIDGVTIRFVDQISSDFTLTGYANYTGGGASI